MHAKSLQSCLTLCNPMDCSLPGSSVHGILQARILEWVAFPFSRGSSQYNPGIKPRSPTLRVDSLPCEPPRKPRNTGMGSLFLLQGNFPTQESNLYLLCLLDWQVDSSPLHHLGSPPRVASSQQCSLDVEHKAD